MAKAEQGFVVPALSQTDLETNTALVVEHQALLERISAALEFFDDDDRKHYLSSDMFDLRYILTPHYSWVAGGKGSQVLEKAPFIIYVLAVGDYTTPTASETRTILVTADGQVCRLPSQGSNRGIDHLDVQVRLDDHRVLKIDCLDSDSNVEVQVGDYGERYHLEIFTDATLLARVEHLRQIAAALSK